MNTPNPYAPPQAAVADVDGPSGVRAGRGTRLLAAILDGFIVSLVSYGPLLLGGSWTGIVTVKGQLDPAVFLALLSSRGIYSLLGFLAWAIVTFILVRRNGQTIAKKLLGIKVVRADGSPASVGRIFWLRNVVNSLLTVIPLVGQIYVVLDSLWIFGSERCCLHDKIADTIVVKA